MQVVSPIDVEKALADELAARIPSASVHAAPAPPDTAAGTVVVQSMGGVQQTPVSDEFDVVAYAYADSYGAAMTAAATIAAAIRGIESTGAVVEGVDWTTTSARPPYEDPDPDRPTLRRATVHATVGARGIPLTIDE